ncbi:MAG: thioredoxin [bacterium]|nr:thioredoxin [bacterium]
MANDNIIELTADNFQSEIDDERPLLVDFWAEWCGPCRMVAPVLDELADELQGKVRIGKLNVDQNQELSMKFGVQSIPTFVLFKGGEVADRMMGAMPKAAFEKFIEKNVDVAPADAAAG